MVKFLKNDSLNVRNQRRNSTAHASLASKPLEFFERTVLAYDNNVLPTDVNTCGIMRCENRSQLLEFLKRTLFAYDNNVLPTDVNTCGIMRCENCSQALQVIPLPKSTNWIDIKLQQRTTPNSDYMSPKFCS